MTERMVNVVMPDGTPGPPVPLEQYARAQAAFREKFGRTFRPATPDDAALVRPLVESGARARAEAGAPSTAQALAGDLASATGFPTWITEPAVSAGLGAVSGASWGLGNKANAVVRAPFKADNLSLEALGRAYDDERERGAAVYESAAADRPVAFIGGALAPNLVGGLAKAPAQLGPLLGPGLTTAAPTLARSLAPLVGAAGMGGLAGLAASEAPSGSARETTDALIPAALNTLLHGAGPAVLRGVERARQAASVINTPHGPVDVGPLGKLAQSPAAREAFSSGSTLAGAAGGAFVDIPGAGYLGPAGGAGAGAVAMNKAAKAALKRVDDAVARRVAPVAANRAYWDDVAAQNATEAAALARGEEIGAEEARRLMSLQAQADAAEAAKFSRATELHDPALVAGAASEAPHPFTPTPFAPLREDFPADVMRGAPTRRTSDFPRDVMAGTAAPPSLELARQPRGARAVDEPLSNVLAGAEDDLRLATTPTGGEVPKGPGVDTRRAIEALHAERTALAETPTPKTPRGPEVRDEGPSLPHYDDEALRARRLESIERDRLATLEAERAADDKAKNAFGGRERPFWRDRDDYTLGPYSDVHDEPAWRTSIRTGPEPSVPTSEATRPVMWKGERIIGREDLELPGMRRDAYDPRSPQSIKTDHRKHVEEKLAKRQAMDVLVRETLGLPEGEPVWPFAGRDTISGPDAVPRALEGRAARAAAEAQQPARQPLESLMTAPAPMATPKAEAVERLARVGNTPKQIAKALGLTEADVKRTLSRNAWTRPLPGAKDQGK